MTIIANLKAGQAILVDDQILIALPAGYRGGCLELDGTPVNGIPQQILINKNSVLEYVTTKPKQILHYKHESGHIITTEAFNLMKSEYEEKYYHPYVFEDYNEDEFVNYPDLDTEFTCRKKMKELESWNPVYSEPEVVREKVEYTIVGEVQDTGSKYITNPLCEGKGTFSNGTFYKVDLYGISADVIKKYQEKYNMTFTPWSGGNGNFKFMKYKDVYLFNEGVIGIDPSDKRVCYAMSLEEAKNKEKEHRDYIESLLDTKLKKVVFKPDALYVQEILNKIHSCHSYIVKIEPMRKSRIDYNLALEKISQTINLIQNYIKENDGTRD